jgi:hypothetical protein
MTLARIYKLTNIDNDEIYVGSTTMTLSKRFAMHKSASKIRPDQKVYKALNTIGWNEVEIVLLDVIETDDKDEIREKEQEYIDLLKPSLNTWSSYVNCPHGRRHRQCIDCNGVGICEHGKRRGQCINCNGASICEHGNRRSTCIECNPVHCDCCNKTTSKGNYKRHCNAPRHKAKQKAECYRLIDEDKVINDRLYDIEQKFNNLCNKIEQKKKKN